MTMMAMTTPGRLVWHGGDPRIRTVYGPYTDPYTDPYLTASVAWRLLDKATQSRSRHQKHEEASPLSIDRLETSESSIHKKQPPESALGYVVRPDSTSRALSHGSCQCMCPPGRGYGRCYDLPTAAKDCKGVLHWAMRDCPAVGIVSQCQSGGGGLSINCTSAGLAIRGDIGNPRAWGGRVQCEADRGCLDLGSGFGVETCRCQPVLYGDYACEFREGSCDSTPPTPYFPPAPSRV